uniref:PH domain-containing protein n=1 Tax=Timema tahoe TaxID=61484 RepID=A0A7R9FEH0_9NEOP|nr:unnamed protein product [Timema tahoe]
MAGECSISSHWNCSHNWSDDCNTEGFLLYYSESEKKSFDKRGYFNFHPKGVIPIGGCIVQPTSDPVQEYVIQISSESFLNGTVGLAAETRFDQERWLQGLREAARITLENSRMGESIIRDLETQGLQLNKEKQCCVVFYLNNFYSSITKEIISRCDVYNTVLRATIRQRHGGQSIRGTGMPQWNVLGKAKPSSKAVRQRCRFQEKVLQEADQLSPLYLCCVKTSDMGKAEFRHGRVTSKKGTVEFRYHHTDEFRN